MDLEREHLPLRYRLCGLGFSISGIALGLLCLDSSLNLIVFLTRDMRLFEIREQPWWSWVIGAPITCGALLGSYLLWGRWTDSSWQRRAGLLVLLNLIDFCIWTFYQGEILGLRVGHLQHNWMINNLASAFGWIEFLLFASLAAEVASHLGMPNAVEAGRSASKFALAGLIISSVLFVSMTDWKSGWPLGPAPPNSLGYLMVLGCFFLRTISSLQVAALCLVAGRYCLKTRDELRREEDENNPFHAPTTPIEDIFPSFEKKEADSFK